MIGEKSREERCSGETEMHEIGKMVNRGKPFPLSHSTGALAPLRDHFAFELRPFVPAIHGKITIRVREDLRAPR